MKVNVFSSWDPMLSITVASVVQEAHLERKMEYLCYLAIPFSLDSLTKANNG
jgi:hypothetical protein